MKKPNQNESLRSLTVKARYLKISARKVNLQAKVLRGLALPEAEKLARFSASKGSRLLYKLLRSGRAAAGEKGLLPDRITVHSLLVGQGPSLKRGQPVARGSYHPIRKKQSHVVLVLKESHHGT